jgi:hypothetical protein
MFPLHTGQRVQVAPMGEFATIVAVNPRNFSVRMADGSVREFGREWLVTGPDEDTDPLDSRWA